MKPAVDGILESALYVEDLNRSKEFYETIFGFETLLCDQRICALGVAGRQVFLLCRRGASAHPSRTPAGLIPGHDGEGRLHVAFSIASSSLEDWKRWLGEHNVPIESTVHWRRGGTSLYFRDPDRHVIELVTPGTWAIY